MDELTKSCLLPCPRCHRDSRVAHFETRPERQHVETAGGDSFDVTIAFEPRAELSCGCLVYDLTWIEQQRSHEATIIRDALLLHLQGHHPCSCRFCERTRAVDPAEASSLDGLIHEAHFFASGRTGYGDFRLCPCLFCEAKRRLAAQAESAGGGSGL